MPTKIEPNFKISYSGNVPDLLAKLNCSLIISTYQAGKLIFICPSKNKLLQIPKHFKKPMGIEYKDGKLAIASIDEITIFNNSKKLAINYPKKPKTYDTLFLPRTSYYTGHIDIHDLNWGKDGLWGVNTLFSCLCKINSNYSFEPKWKPNFISELMPEDRCHLNGMALKDGIPAFATSLSTTDKKEGWRKTIESSGVLMEVPSGKILLNNLSMPHSPRYSINNELFLLLSGTGELLKYSIKSGKTETIQLPGFARGMAEHRDFLFIGLSKIRKSSKTFNRLPIAQKATNAGVLILYKPTLAIIGEIIYDNTVEEIYDIQVLPDILKPGILSPENEIHKQSISAPDLNFWKKNKKTLA